MDEIQVKWAELHTGLFLTGTNLGVKLDPSKRSGLILTYHRNNGELIVQWNKSTAIVPVTNVVAMVIGQIEAEKPQITHPMVANIGSAQVETPMSHVHAGYGHGKTGKKVVL